MALKDREIKNLSPQEKPFKKYDANGLFLEVRPSGSKMWRFRFKFDGKSKLLTFGHYPGVSLKQARELRDEAKYKIAQGVDPALEKKQLREEQARQQAVSENTFENVAIEWWLSKKDTWSNNYAATTWRRLEVNLLPWIGKTPVKEIEPPLLLEQLRRIEKRGACDTAHRIAQIAGNIFQYAIAAGKVNRNPAMDIKGALKRAPVKHMAALTEPEDVKLLMRAIDAYQGSLIVNSGLKVSALTFVRPGELRKATWDEIDFEDALWKIPAERMKMKRDHLVPLSRQVLGVLNDLYSLTHNCRGNFIFPGERMNGRPMSENTVNVAIRSMGFSKDQMTAHGFRTMASTRLHESGLWDSLVVELQLAHVDKNSIRGIYNRALYLDERRKMMQWWADYLDSLREGAKIIPIRSSSDDAFAYREMSR
ncbi:MAG: tyrosine-type recombinase/integrase [Desulfonatronovibrionaceae bacterium]